MPLVFNRRLGLIQERKSEILVFQCTYGVQVKYDRSTSHRFYLRLMYLLPLDSLYTMNYAGVLCLPLYFNLFRFFFRRWKVVWRRTEDGIWSLCVYFFTLAPYKWPTPPPHIMKAYVVSIASWALSGISKSVRNRHIMFHILNLKNFTLLDLAECLLKKYSHKMLDIIVS